MSHLSSVTVRDARPADAEVIAEFNLRMAEETEGLRLAPATVRRGVEALLCDPAKGRYFVAEQDGQVVGQSMITHEWSDWRNGDIWWLQSVYVQPERRHAGVFGALFRHIESLAVAEGNVRALRLYMHSANARARAAYGRLGMQGTEYCVFEKTVRAGY